MVDIIILFEYIICFIAFFIIFKEDVCTWYVHGVHFHGVGYVKQNGQGSVWGATGLVNT